MIVKRFVGRDAREALALAKLELGEDAIVISSGTARQTWWRFWETGYQVLVAVDDQRPPAPAEAAATAAPVVSPPAPAGPPPPAEAPPLPWDEMLRLLRGLDGRLAGLEGQPRGARGEGYRLLRARGLEEDWARTLAAVLPEDRELAPGVVRRQLEQELARRLGPPQLLPAQGPVVAVFVGPTGAGKTTTIAKLAAYFRLTQQKEVLLVTADTFRAGATEQLKTFGSLLAVPVEVVMRPQELAARLAQGVPEVVLVDTAGHSPRHAMHMAETRAWLEAARPTHLLLTVPATMRSEEVVAAGRAFTGGRPAAVVLTKVDEAASLGAALGGVLELGWPLAYLTDGQQVPEDIEAALADTVAGRLFAEEGESRHDG
ncbi:Flagellar biosynthesis protein FlhF [Candidatus Hydrogenisulfobacillus filiaventi]|uniref:Flagellar biosynthesis protein FlhF n=1 Tax=Candidatus Hydrogenisulfobacillus filiaventi TaxID=2707344 RepID=A0A6F8ZE33_9FIRM|nr:Flagellar biosynthesis protein FlhF [Candidatus Hydrogenisulfobacillus filiaventi]